MRYLIALATASMIVVVMWPTLRRFAPRRPQPGGAPKPATKGELIYLAILTAVALSFTISTLLWLFGK